VVAAAAAELEGGGAAADPPAPPPPPTTAEIEGAPPPRGVSQTRTVFSREAEARAEPSGAQERSKTSSVWPLWSEKTFFFRKRRKMSLRKKEKKEKQRKARKKTLSPSPKHPDDAPLVPLRRLLVRVSAERGRSARSGPSSGPPSPLPPQVELAAVAACREPGSLGRESHAVDPAGVLSPSAAARGAGVGDRGGALVGPAEAPELMLFSVGEKVSVCV
jgi:hypothetical protein